VCCNSTSSDTFPNADCMTIRQSTGTAAWQAYRYSLVWVAVLLLLLLRRRLQGTEQLALLLSSAAASLQQPVADGTLPGQQRHLVLNFCLAIKVRSTMHPHRAGQSMQKACSAPQVS
jgi:hypothetical protein